MIDSSFFGSTDTSRKLWLRRQQSRNDLLMNPERVKALSHFLLLTFLKLSYLSPRKEKELGWRKRGVFIACHTRDRVQQYVCVNS